MEIRISIHTTKPLTGSATTAHRAPLRFEGWLELLGVLSTLIGHEGGPIPCPETTDIPQAHD